MKRLKQRSAFTLIEILIFAAILGTFLVSLTALLLTGKFFQRNAEQRSIAMSVVSMKMEEYLAKSYAGLQETTVPLTGIENGITWTVSVEKKEECPNGCKVESTTRIPYKVITVTAAYDDRSSRGAQQKKEIRLVNMVPYPYIHIASYASSPETLPIPPEITFNNNGIVTKKPFYDASLDYDALIPRLMEKGYVDANLHVPPSFSTLDLEFRSWFPLLSDPQFSTIEAILKDTRNPTNPINFQNIQNAALNLSYPVGKHLLIVYNISTKINKFTGLEQKDTILTGIFINGVNISVITRTPIVLQPLISNVVGVNLQELVSKGTIPANNGQYLIELRWNKDTPSGIITAPEYNFMILAVEEIEGN